MQKEECNVMKNKDKTTKKHWLCRLGLHDRYNPLAGDYIKVRCQREGCDAE